MRPGFLARGLRLAENPVFDVLLWIRFNQVDRAFFITIVEPFVREQNRAFAGLGFGPLDRARLELPAGHFATGVAVEVIANQHHAAMMVQQLGVEVDFFRDIFATLVLELHEAAAVVVRRCREDVAIVEDRTRTIGRLVFEFVILPKELALLRQADEPMN